MTNNEAAIDETLAVSRLADIYLDGQSAAERLRRSAQRRADRGEWVVERANRDEQLSSRLEANPLQVMCRMGALAPGDELVIRVPVPLETMDLVIPVLGWTWVPPTFEWRTEDLSDGSTFTWLKMTGRSVAVETFRIIPEPVPA